MQSRDNNDDDSTKKTLLTLMATNANLAISKVAAVLPTQPLQVIMRVQQGALRDSINPRIVSVIEAARIIYRGNPAKGDRPSLTRFFNGSVAGISKEGFKNGVYKGALITGSPDLAENALISSSLAFSMSHRQYHFTRCMVAGLIAACADVLLGNPLELLATYRTTSQGNSSDAKLWRELQARETLAGKINLLYRGAMANGVKSFVAFSTYFGTNTSIKHHVIKMYDAENQKSHLPWYVRLTSALMSGGAVAITSSGFDIVKTQAQMPRPSDKTVLQGIYSNVRTYGLRGLTAGLPIKFTMVTMGWGINNFATEQATAQIAAHYIKPKF